MIYPDHTRPNMNVTESQAASFLNGVAYGGIIKHTHGLEYEKAYTGNGHHWAQEMAKAIADLFVSRYREVLIYWLPEVHRFHIWRVVSSVVTPIVLGRAQRGLLVMPNIDIWTLALIDSVVETIFQRKNDIMWELIAFEARLAFEDPYNDPRTVADPVAAMKHYRPA